MLRLEQGEVQGKGAQIGCQDWNKERYKDKEHRQGARTETRRYKDKEHRHGARTGTRRCQN